jgi:3-deoxy-D-manno-octulosonic-acid transferase
MNRPLFYMMHTLYNAATFLAAPVGAAYCLMRPHYRPLMERLSPYVPEEAVGAVWIQACSVGEAMLARPLVAALAREVPRPRLITASTIAGRRQVETLFPEDNVAWFPFDRRATVREFLKRLQPVILVLVETEIWPNVLLEAQAMRIPVVVVNGRLSDRHFDRYRRYRTFFRPVFGALAAVGAQNADFAERFVALGVRPERVCVTGAMKFDGVPRDLDRARLEACAKENGLSPEAPILVFGSARQGDAALAVDVWRRVQETLPDTRLVLVPRHPDRAEIPAGVPVQRRSAIQAGEAPRVERMLLVDTFGELPLFYGLATVAIIGGSFRAGVGGHNPVEPAALGIPTVFGPRMENFRDVAATLVARQGAVQTHTDVDLASVVIGLLRDPEARQRLGRNAQATVAEHAGATERNLALIQEHLRTDTPP